MILTKILDVWWMFLAHEQDVAERCLFFSKGSIGAGKNEFVSHYTCLQPHFSVKYKGWK